MIRVPLETIRDNPFQSRLTYDEIDELADSILAMAGTVPETGGLLQVPPARIVVLGDPDQPPQVLDPTLLGPAGCLAVPGAVVQLGFGHRRAKAFAALRRRGYGEYTTFPVEVQVLTDAQMADLAHTENAQRRDVSDIEKALLYQKAVDRLGLTQAKVGERWGLSQAAVANTIRLLGLPEDVRAAVHKGELPAHTAREALPLMQIPGFTLTLAAFRNTAGKTMTTGEMTEHVKTVVKARAVDLFDAVWQPRDEWLPTQAPAGLSITAVVGPCGDCPHRVNVLRHPHCTRKSCFETKTRIYRRTVAGPDKAGEMYTGSRSWRAVTVPTWKACHACGSGASDGIGQEGWRTAPQFDKPGDYLICPSCWTLAGLPEPTPEPEPAPPPVVPQPSGLRPPAVTAYSPAHNGEMEDYEPDGDEDYGREATPDDEEAEVPAPVTPRPAVPAPALTRPATVMREIQPPPPPTPPADVLTARILPGADLGARRVLVAIGPENAGPAHLRAGAFPDLAGLVADLVDAYFHGNHDGHQPAEAAGEPEILMEV